MTEMTPRPADWIETAPIKIRASREVHATAAEVWAAITDHERWPQWFDALDRAEATGGEGLGSTRSVSVRSWRLDEEFVVWDEPRSFGFTVLAAEGPLGRLAESLNERIDIQVLTPERTRITYLQGWQPRSPFGGRLLKLAGRAVTAQLRTALAKLEAHIETERAG